jgi:hypothetical protein
MLFPLNTTLFILDALGAGSLAVVRHPFPAPSRR